MAKKKKKAESSARASSRKKEPRDRSSRSKVDKKELDEHTGRTIARRKAAEDGGTGLKRHIIVCGIGDVGRHVIEDLERRGKAFLAIEHDPLVVERMEIILGHVFPHTVGDASDDTVLEQAGIQKAEGLMTTFDDDKMNVFVTLSARRLNPTFRIVSRAADEETVAKLRRAGADSVVSTNFIGGMRVASEMVRTHVVEFLDIMMGRRDRPMKIEEIPLGPGSAGAGRRLSDAGIQEAGNIMVLALREHASGEVTYNPRNDRILRAGDTVFVMGHVDEIEALKKTMA